MYKVFFVDDEIIVREGIRSCLAWEKTQFSLVGEAQDGEMALSMLQEIKPDILITDLRMPFMNGLDLAKIIKKMQPWIKIIILSGHDEFEYAKQAISIGIEDYLLKPFTAEDLLQSLEKAAILIEEEKKKNRDVALLRQQIESNAEIIRDHWLIDFVMGGIPAADCIQKAAELGIDLIGRYYTVLAVSISAGSRVGFANNTTGDNMSSLLSKSGDTVSENAGVDIFQIKTILRSLLEQKNAILFSLSPDTFAVIIKTAVRETTEEEVYATADAIKYEILRNNPDCIISIGLGSVMERLAQIPKSYVEAEKALHIADRAGSSKIISTGDIQSETASSLLNLGGDPIVDQLKYALLPEVDHITAQYVAMLGEYPFQFSIIGSYLIIEVIIAASRIIEELGGNPKTLLPDMLSHDFVATAVVSIESFSAAIKKILQTVLEYRDSCMTSRYGDMILKAKRYIDEHFNDQDICLHSVAEEVNVSPNHFSAVFSQECGVSFIEYLTSVRIEQAKKLLLQSEMRIADIAYEAGFNDPHYFSFMFKKNTGLAPKEYRLENKK